MVCIVVLYTIGNQISSSGPQEGPAVSQSAEGCHYCSILAHSAQCGNEVRIQRGLWQKWKDFNDHFEYYTFRAKLFHYVICIRRCDTGATVTIDLVVSKAESKWYIRVREAEWKPGNRNVTLSKHKWHAAAALNAVHTFGPEFGKWTAIANNCSTWAKGVVGFMSNDEMRKKCECEPITDDFDKLSSFGDSIGVELTYLSSRQAREVLPQPEEEEEESGNQSENVITEDQGEEPESERADLEGGNREGIEDLNNIV